jgi:hypothetical protein
LEKNATVTLRTRLIEKLNITHPVLLAPMGSVSGGRLAGAVSEAGGLGLIGGGYGDRDWLEREFAAAGNRRVGCGFITWSLAKEPGLLDVALARRPAALMLSFGDPRPFAKRIQAEGVVLMCQVQSRDHTLQALDAGAEIIVARAPRPAATAAPAPRCRWCRRSSTWWRGAPPRWWWSPVEVLSTGAGLQPRSRSAPKAYWSARAFMHPSSRSPTTKPRRASPLRRAMRR